MRRLIERLVQRRSGTVPEALRRRSPAASRKANRPNRSPLAAYRGRLLRTGPTAKLARVARPPPREIARGGAPSRIGRDRRTGGRRSPHSPVARKRVPHPALSQRLATRRFDADARNTWNFAGGLRASRAAGRRLRPSAAKRWHCYRSAGCRNVAVARVSTCFRLLSARPLQCAAAGGSAVGKRSAERRDAAQCLSEDGWRKFLA